MAYITQFYTWATGNTVTAARLNGNLSNIIDGLDSGTKDINVAKLQIAGADIIDGSQNITITGDITGTSSTSVKPLWTLKNTNADANCSELQFYKLSASPEDNDDLGNITFYGDDDGTNKTLFGQLVVESTDVTDGTEDGKMTIYTMTGGTSTASLTISSGAVNCNVSLDIASSTVVTGILDEDNMASDAADKLATQQSIKKYVDDQILTINTWQEVMDNGNTFYTATNDGNPQARIGATDAEELHIQTVYDSGAQTLDYVLFQTDVASATADKGEFRFNVDGTEISHINDSGINVVSGLAYYINDTSVLNATTLGSAVVTSSLTTVGALDSGSITSGFGAIDNGASNITTGGIIKLDVDGTAKNAAGSLTMGAGDDSGIYFDGTNTVLQTSGGFSVESPILAATTASITASVTQTQGQQALSSDVNEVSVVANDDDVVTAPSASSGKEFTVIHNGANILQLYPASGDNLGAGVNTSVKLSAGTIATYRAYDETNYELVNKRNDVEQFIYVHTGAGHGSSGTKIRRIETSSTTTGTAITVANSSTNGTSFTINEDGLYSMTYNDVYTTTAFSIGISKNASSLTTNVNALAIGEILAYSESTTGIVATCSIVVRLSDGDVIRPHTDGNPNATSDHATRFTIVKIC